MCRIANMSNVIDDWSAGGAVQRAHGPVQEGPARPGGGRGESRRGRSSGQQDESEELRKRDEGTEQLLIYIYSK